LEELVKITPEIQKTQKTMKSKVLPLLEKILGSIQDKLDKIDDITDQTPFESINIILEKTNEPVESIKQIRKLLECQTVENALGIDLREFGIKLHG